MGEDSPSDRFDVVTRKGQHFGYPFCHAGDMLIPIRQGERAATTT